MDEQRDIEDEEWERLMRSAFRPELESQGRRLYMIVRRGVLMIMSAFDAYYGIDDPRKVDRGKRNR